MDEIACKISKFADYTTLFMNGQPSTFQEISQEFLHYRKESSFKINECEITGVDLFLCRK